MCIDDELIAQTSAFVNAMSLRKVSCIVLLVPLGDNALSPVAASNMFMDCKEKADALRAWTDFLENAETLGKVKSVSAPPVN